MIPASWFMILCNPFPLSVGRTCGLLLANRISQRWWDATFANLLHKILAFTFHRTLSFVGSDATSHHIACCFMEWITCKVWRAATGWQLARNWGPKSCNGKELNSANRNKFARGAWAAAKNAAANTLPAAWWEPKQEANPAVPTSDTQSPWDSQRVLV